MAICKTTGKIRGAKCSCEQQMDRRCSHIACILFGIEDMSAGAAPRMRMICTSTTQQWGKGKRPTIKPQPIHESINNKRLDAVIKFDPRPQHLIPKTDNDKQKRVEAFLKNLQSSAKQSMFEDIFAFKYSDYQLTSEREALLITQCQSILTAMFNTGPPET